MGATALVVVLVLLCILEGRVLLVLLAGVLFALALLGTSRWVARKTRLPFRVALAAIAVLLVAGTATGLYFLGAGLAEQVDTLLRELPTAWHAAVDAIKRRPALAPLAGPLDAAAPGKTPLTQSAASLLAGAGGAMEMLGGAIVIFFIGVYGAAQPDAYVHVALALVPPAHRMRAARILIESRRELTRWLAGRAVAMVLVGVLVTVGLLWMKIPLAWSLGVVAGALTFVEYLGAFASAAPAMLLAFTRSPVYAVWVGVLFTGVHILEGYVLTPLLVRTTVKFPPAYTLAAQVILGSVFGVLGLTLATPVTILATILVRRLYLAPRDRHAAGSR